MSEIVLTPKFAAELASNVYLLKDSLGCRGFLAKYNNEFNLGNTVLAESKTSTLLVVKSKHITASLSKPKG